ncbi:MAG: hypothetical protein GY810_29020 [Aureispira sp.]|nr:hypothetical protein [Aureispira sp.]
MVHTSEIKNYNGSTQELVEELGNLRYDALANILDLLAQKIEQDGQKDAERRRVKLASNLFAAAQNLNETKEAIEKAWDICEPYMKD